jgi:hypothetical protein
MTQNQQKFNAAAVGEKFQLTCNKLDNLLIQGNNENLSNIRQKLHQELKVYREDGIIKVALLGNTVQINLPLYLRLQDDVI